MSEGTKAVFLSYASQDKDVAKRICDALRAAGVEVWFDQSELRGGDAWDAMIRKRIKECALFVPVITPTTNARAEGYFRLEWKLAVDRSHLMADDAPFLFPIVIGDVTDATARVPDKFRDVQWTRLRLDETPGELAGRVAKLLSGGSMVGGVLYPDGLKESGYKTPPTSRRPRWQWWMIFPIFGTIMGLMFAVMPMWKAFNRSPQKQHPVRDSRSQTPEPKLSEARQLAEKARVLLDAIDSSADDYATAEGLVKRALELEQNDGEIWAISSRLNSMFMSRAFDNSGARREPARSQAERALKLAPDSVESLLAVARANRNTDAPRAEAALRQALALAPQDGRVLLNLGSLFRVQNRLDEALEYYEQAAAVPEVRPLARYDQFLVSFYRRKFADAERYVQESVTALPTANSVTGLAMVELTWRGLPEEALRVLAAAPGKVRAEPRPVIVTVLAAQMNRQPEVALAALRRFPADYVNDAWYSGPKALLVGLGESQAGRPEAARVAWESGIALLRRRMQDSPNNAEEHLRLGELLAWSGQTEAALGEVRVYEQLTSSRTVDWTVSPARVYAALGRADEAVPLLAKELVAPPSGRWPLTPALLRLDPLWDKIRGDPRFQKLCEDPPAQAAAPAAKVADKSIAVLPFANMSEDKEATAFFADGVHEDILTSLVGIRDLRVVSRTSVMDYRGTTKKIPEIGRELQVAYVLEGSVRRAGNKVRVTGQLIKAATDEHVWAKSYDRDLTDIFAIQAELAQTIATELDAALSPREQKLLAERPTTNLAAYDLYLKAREIESLGPRVGREDVARRVTLAEGAVALDPKFAQAWAELAEAHVGMFASSLDTTPARLAKARAALDRARALAPDSPVVLRAIGVYHMLADLDGAKAIEQFERILAVQPNDVDCLVNLGVAQRLIGRWPDAIRTVRTRMKLEPGNPVHARELVNLLWAVRRYDEVRAELAQLKGDSDEKEQWQAWLTFRATGSRAALDDFYARLEARSPDSPLLREVRAKRALARSDYAEYGRLQGQRMLGTFDRELTTTIYQAWAMKRSGDAAGARQLLGDWPASLRARLELEPDNTQWLRGLASVAAILGNHEEALRCINHAADLMPFEKDSQRAFTIRDIRAVIYADMGDKARAVEQLAELLRHPNPFLNVHGLADDPRYASLRGDPGFEALLRDPKNNAPLF
jgi:TolB-like protein/Tfp pilus assembly protein PilF